MMRKITRPNTPSEIHAIFARLNATDVEQFYQNYQLWTLQQQIRALQTQIAGVQQQMAENHEQMRQVQPSVMAMATLVQLQAQGVNNIILDRMLERGEAWLDQTMQRLAYCEQLDVIQNNYTYTEWCENALEGAYDWIDSMSTDNTLSPSNTEKFLDEVTEEILLQKLMSEETDDETSMAKTTLKRTAIRFDQTAEILHLQNDESPDLPYQECMTAGTNNAPDSEHVADEQRAASEHAIHTPVQEECILTKQATTPEQVEHIPAPGKFTPNEASATSASPGDFVEHASAGLALAQADPQVSSPFSQQNGAPAKPGRKRSFLRRLFFAISGR